MLMDAIFAVKKRIHAKITFGRAHVNEPDPYGGST